MIDKIKPIEPIRNTDAGGWKFNQNVLVAYTIEGKPKKIFYSWDEISKEFGKDKDKLKNSIRRAASVKQRSKSSLGFQWQWLEKSSNKMSLKKIKDIPSIEYNYKKGASKLSKFETHVLVRYEKNGSPNKVYEAWQEFDEEYKTNPHARKAVKHAIYNYANALSAFGFQWRWRKRESK